MIINIDGHDIEVAGDGEIGWDALGKPIPVKFNTGESFQVMIPAHGDKSTLVKVEMGGENLPKDEYLILQPPTKSRSGNRMGFAELRPIRIPRYDSTDHIHQFQLFDSVGRVAVASGHVEMAMKKVLLSLRGGDCDLMSPDLPAEWDALAKALRPFCDGSTELVTRLESLLDDADEKKLREQRNDVIHGYWWMVSAHESLINARYYRPKSGIDPAMMFNSATDLQKFGQELFALAYELESLVAPDWPIAFFSSDPNPPKSRKFAVHDDVPDGAPLRHGERIESGEPAVPSKPKPGKKPNNCAKPKNGNNPGKRKRR